nr:hypothetical protein [Methanobacterium formicicum]
MEYGPPLEPLLEVLVDGGWNATIICETPFLEKDALLMKAVHEKNPGKEGCLKKLMKFNYLFNF